MTGSECQDDNLENIKKEDERIEKDEEKENPNPESLALQITRRKKRKRQDDSIENFVRENASMLAKKNPKAGKMFKCKDCDKEYSSHQALGGHRAAHKRDIGTDNSGGQSGQNPSQPKQHHCKLCGKGFDIGQALGGHMRMHWNKSSTNNKLKKIMDDDNDDDDDIVNKVKAGTMILLKLFSDEDVARKESLNTKYPGECSYASVDASTSNSHGKERFEFDLNLTPHEHNESLDEDSMHDHELS